MKTLISDKILEIPINEIKLKHNKDVKLGNQILFNYLNKFITEKDQILLSIVLPSYNEEKTIRSILESLPYHKSIELIVIDDYSTDNTYQEIKKVKILRDIKLIRHKKNIGYGGSIISGMKYTKGKVIVTMDTDGQHSPRDILKLIKPIFEGKADCTIGSRYLGTNHYNLPLRTRLGEAIIEKIIQVFFGQKIMNNQNGFRAFSNKLIPIYELAKFKGFTFTTETIMLAAIYNKKIKEYPIEVFQREFGSSKINLFKLILNLCSCFICSLLLNIKINLLKK